MKPFALVSARVAAVMAAALIAFATASGQAKSPAAIDQQTYTDIVACLQDGREIVMTPKLECVDRNAGDPKAEKEGMPLAEKNWDEVCERKDPRRLPADIVKHIVKEEQIASSGIRIIGAVFCDGLDLVGVEVPYSLVLDRSLVKGPIDARNAHIKGDFSFEYAVILGNLRLNRAQVDGSVYGGASFMRRLRVHDTRIEGSWHQRNSLILLDAFVVRAKISGDLDLRNSAFSRLWIRSSQIAGTVALDESEARCAYHINSSTIGYLTAENAGFGVIKRATDGNVAVDYSWWYRALSRTKPDDSYKRDIFDSAPVREIAEAELKRIGERAQFVASQRKDLPHELDWRIPGCKDETRAGSKTTVGLEGLPGSPYLEFYVFETTVQSALCLKGLAWPIPAGSAADDAHPVTILALNGTHVAGNLVIDLWGDEATSLPRRPQEDETYERVARKHKFEAIGLSAGAAIYNFGDSEKPYFTYLDGLRFDRVHKATPACASESVSKVSSQVELPSVDEVVRWLNKNAAPSSQPFNAFVQAFDKAGGSTTELRVARKSADLCRHIMTWLPGIEAGFLCASGLGSQSAPDPVLAPVQATFRSVLSGTADLVATAFESLLWAVADHGFRPGKVVGPIVTVLVFFWLLFWFGLRIVGFDPQTGERPPPGEKEPWPIGFMFLFDRLIPQYRIRDEHYAIARYYRRATRAEKKADRAKGKAPCPVNYFGFKIPVRPLDEDGADRVETCLVVLRIIGVGLTVFVFAAIGALVAR